MGDIFKKVIWWFIAGSIILAVFHGVGSVNNIYPEMKKESVKFEAFIKHLTDKLNLEHVKPLKSIVPELIPSKSPSPSPTK